ncbi:hypothetical protein FAIPA1_360024 [Frankia sp. AiPs1]
MTTGSAAGGGDGADRNRAEPAGGRCGPEGAGGGQPRPDGVTPGRAGPAGADRTGADRTDVGRAGKSSGPGGVRRQAHQRGNERGGPAQGARRPAGPAGPPGRTQHPGEAWNIFGTLTAGLAFWGLVGFGADRLFGFRALFLPIGLGVGIAAAMYLVIYRLTRR